MSFSFVCKLAGTLAEKIIRHSYKGKSSISVILFAYNDCYVSKYFVPTKYGFHKVCEKMV